ncbi:MAG: DUF192 domain-containing protein [Pseudomonadota bacterium]
MQTITDKPRLRPGFFFASLASAALLTSACSASTSPDELDESLLEAFGRAELSIDTGTQVHAFSVYVADSPEERRQGLMFVETMPEDVGMLFISDSNTRQSMWMKNTILSLDMLFVDANGVVESVAANTTPGSLKSIASGGPVCCVLELNAGTAEKLGIDAGDRLIHPHFATP